MIDPSHALSVKRQAQALGISRGSVYYLSKPVCAADLAIMRRIDELHMNYPFAGSRMLRDLLRAEGLKIGRLHVSTLMKKMAIEAIYRRPNTSKAAAGHKIYPYLLRKLPIVRPNRNCSRGWQKKSFAKTRDLIHPTDVDRTWHWAELRRKRCPAGATAGDDRAVGGADIRT